MAVPLVEMIGISKAYPGCLANDAIDLRLEAGRVHALLGENGAGKSTLVKILYGLLASDSGSINWQGKRVNIASPGFARELGIAMVFQHFSLFDSLSVLENIALGMDVDASDELRDQIIEVSARYGLPLNPARSVFTLSVGERQRIEIVRCLLQEPKLLIMDEPTSVLTPAEVEDLFVTLERLADEGMAILYISHKLEEIRQLCDEATILRGGKKVAEADPRAESVHSLAALMMGSEVPSLSVRDGEHSGEVLLSLDTFSQQASDAHGISLQGINLEVHAGEIVGIAGVAGNGQDELLQVLSGEISAQSADALTLCGQQVGHEGVGERRRRGLCCVPEERLGHAAVPDLSLADNAFLTAHHRKSLRLWGFISPRRNRDFANEIIQRFNVQCHGAHSLASSLSGGNLQKFIVGREILQAPRVLVVSQPTWGVDAGAASAIHAAIQELADNGAAILIISQDLDELMQATDRIGALCAGRLSTFFRTRDITVQQVGLLMGGETLDGVVS
ncbi:Galactose/methyl galactoside import ATP-binding protein MglA [Granulosicoccus antarcticus IMCC3135]|uniref:Galactose/methyl galactoside import ATP-binding protein MglA n=2 Tax=Granulosicoccus TaxID=437504 RepID=A0A2Z2NVM7_9GAMM|nr:Galactose/methyl galactoside import ATP-binding protein MglA [Granulosicoccus antarcticus IMCC3135]